jgi:hypothetical protein
MLQVLLFLEKCHSFSPCGILWEVAEPTTARREARFCQAGFDQGLKTIKTPLPPWSTPQATVGALWSVGMGLARSCALSAVSSRLAEGMHRKEQTVRPQWRAWDDAVPRKRGPQRQALPGETCFAPLLGWVVRWGQGPWGVLTFALGGLVQDRDGFWFGHDRGLWYGQSCPLGG